MPNSGPILTGLSPSRDVVENVPTLLAPTAILADLDGTFAGGTLVVSGLFPDDVVSIRNQGVGLRQIGFQGGLVTFEGNPIGVATGGIGGTLLVVFTPGVNPVGVTAVINNLTYTTTSDTPVVDHILELKVVDPTGAAAVAPITLTEQTGGANPFDSFHIGDRPVFADINGDGRAARHRGQRRDGGRAPRPGGHRLAHYLTAHPSQYNFTNEGLNTWRCISPTPSMSTTTPG